MTRITVLALSKWAHFSWLPRGERALTERAQAEANADLLARFPQLLAIQKTPDLPPFAALPRPACAKVLRAAAALAHARLVRRIVSAEARKRFAACVAPHVLHEIQRNSRGKWDDADQGATPDVLDRVEMTAAGLQVALRAMDDPALRVLVELRLPRIVAQRAAQFGACNASVKTARDWLDAAYALAGGEAC